MDLMSDEDLPAQAKVVAEQMEEVMDDPGFQKQVERVAEPMLAIVSDAEKMREVMADPSVQEKVSRISEQMHALLEEPCNTQQVSPQKKSLASFLLAHSQH